MTQRSWTRGLLIATVVVSAFAGALVDRSIVATPAWKALGPNAWGDYSRHADLGNGVILYPVYGFGLLVLAVATAVSYRRNRSAPRAAGPPIYCTAVCAVGVLATTAKAAPIMLSTAHLGDNSAALQHAFEQFTVWGVYLRGALGLLAFLTAVLALAVYPRIKPGP